MRAVNREAGSLRVGVVTTYQPATHYSRYLCGELRKDVALTVLVDRDSRNYSFRDDAIIPCWSNDSAFVRDIVGTARLLELNVVHAQHEFNMYGGFAGTWRFVSLLRALRKANVRVVVTLHAVISKDDLGGDFLRMFELPRFPLASTFALLGFRVFYRSVCKLAQKTIVHSIEAAKKLERSYGVPPARISVIPHGIPAKESEYEAHPVPRQILFFGYVLPRKGLEDLVTAIGILQERGIDARLIIAGGELPRFARYAARLREKIARSALREKIFFAGFIDEPEIHRLYKSSSVVALPYRISVSSSAPMALAIQHRVPIVATDTPFFREILSQFAFLRLAPTGDPGALADALQEVICNEETARRMRMTAAKAAHEWSWKRIAHRTSLEYHRR